MDAAQGPEQDHCCIECGKPITGDDANRQPCPECRSWIGKIGELDIAIRSDDDPERLRYWPEVRYLLRKRFGQDFSDGDLWERCTDWLRGEHQLSPNQYLVLSVTDLISKLRELADQTPCFEPRHGQDSSQSADTQKETFWELLTEFRQAWSDYGRVYHTIRIFAPSSYDSRNPPSDRQKHHFVAQVCMPLSADEAVTPDMNNSTLIGYAVIERQGNNQEAANRIRALFNRAGAALPFRFETAIRGLCPWYMNEPATRWLALMLIDTGTAVINSNGLYTGEGLITQPLKLSAQIIEAHRLNTDDPIVAYKGAGMPVCTGEIKETTVCEDFDQLIVDHDLLQIRYQGKVHSVSSEEARMIQLLIDNSGEWVSMEKNDFSKPSDTKKKLPDEIRELITTEKGKGYRINHR